MIPFVIWSIVAVIFVIIGIRCFCSQEAVGFFTGVKSPQISEKHIKSYNRSVGILWLVFSAAWELLGVPILFLKQNSPIFMFLAIAAMFLIIILTVVYLRIEARFKDKK